MQIITLDILIGFGGSAIIALAAWRMKALSVSGMIAAIFVGAAIYIFGGIESTVILMVFFISGSILSKLNTKNNSPSTHVEGAGGWQNLSQTRGRDWKQVLCNGGAAAFGVIWLAARPDLREQATLFFLGTLATATADTFATEIGTRFGKRTYNILSLRPMQKGLSGGVSLVGILASIIGAALIAIMPSLIFYEEGKLCGLVLVHVFPVVLIAGCVGALLDSLIGAAFQAKFTTPEGVITEDRANATLASGIRYIGNNATNLIATIWGGLIAVGLMNL